MKLFEFISTAHAQTSNQFKLGNFNFLNPFLQRDAGSALDSVLSRAIGLVLTVAAIVAFFYLIVSGFQYMTAGGDADKATKARQGIINAIIGIVIILVSYIVITYVANVVGGAGTDGGVVSFIQQLT